jgi:hypothetical protein
VKTSTLFAAAALALIGCSGATTQADTAGMPGGISVAVSTVPVDLRSSDPTDRRLGQLIYRGGVSVVPADEAFGGLSAFKISADGSRFVSVEDNGHWATGALTYGADGDLTGVADVRVAPMLNAAGAVMTGKSEADAEGLAFADPLTLAGDAYVSFEGDDRVLRFDFQGAGIKASGMPIAIPETVLQLRQNNGLEVLASLPDGRLVAMAEEGVGGENDDSPGWVIDPTTGAAVQFTVKRELPYALTDATLLPDGQLLVLSRRFSPLTGPGAELRVFDPATFVEGATVEGQLVATLFAGVTVDNMEGVAARKTADGKTLIYVVSDDNFQRPLQRTLIMMFELAE